MIWLPNLDAALLVASRSSPMSGSGFGARMSVRRSLLYAGLTFSIAALAFSLGSWFTQRAIAQQLADSDARLAALRDDMARSILQIRQAQAAPSGTDRPARSPRSFLPQELAERVRRRDQAAASERDGPVSRAPPPRAPRKLRRAERHRQLRQDELRHGRLSGQRLLHHRQARRHRARTNPSTGASRAASRPSRSATRAGISPRDSSTPATRTSRCTPATGRSSACAARSTCKPLRIDTSLRLRLRGADLPAWQRLLEGHHPQHRLRRAADAERPRDLPDRRASGRVGRRRAEPAAATSWVFRSAGCRATTASRSSCRCRAEMFRQGAGATGASAAPAPAVAAQPAASCRTACQVRYLGSSEGDSAQSPSRLSRRSALIFSHPSSRRLISFSNPRSVGR